LPVEIIIKTKSEVDYFTLLMSHHQ